MDKNGNSISVVLPRLRDTKNTVVYGFEDRNSDAAKQAAVDTQYIKKSALPNPHPEQVTLTLTF